MALALDFKVEGDNALRRALNQFARKVGVPVKFIVTDQMRLWVQDLMSAKVYVPKNKGQGRKAVDSALSNVFAPLVAGTTTTPSSVDPSTILVRSASGAVWATDVELMDKSASNAAMRTRHESMRNEHTGKVRKVRNQKRSGYTFVPKLHVTSLRYDQYRKRVRGSVGKLKKGWAEAVNQLAAAVNTSAKFPKWLNTAPSTGGSANINLTNGSGYVSATNNVSYAETKYERWLPGTRLKRVKDIGRQLAAKGNRIDRLVEQFNRGKF